jgi:hypothetical protein
MRTLPLSHFGGKNRWFEYAKSNFMHDYFSTIAMDLSALAGYIFDARNGVEIKVQIDAHLLPSYFLFFYLNRSAIRAKKQKI